MTLLKFVQRQSVLAVTTSPKLRPTVSDRVFHYTVGTCLIGIIASGKILPAVMHLNVLVPAKPAVWFSRRLTWEPTASKRLLRAVDDRTATIAEMVALGGTLVRIEVRAETAPHGWAYHAKWHEPKAMAMALAQVAREIGADPSDWWVSYEPVLVAQCVSVEYSDDGQVWRLFGRFAEGGVFLSEAPGVLDRCCRAVRIGA